MTNAYFGQYGGVFMPEVLMPSILELEKAFYNYAFDDEFKSELASLQKEYLGRPTPLTYAGNLSKKLGCRVYLKREDLLHSGAHKMNNTMGQVLLAKRMGKTKIIAETGAGQHGVAVATACAKLGMKCTVYMGTKDVARQAPNVYRMKLLGAEVVPVDSGSCTLKDAINEALRAYAANPDIYYVLGSAVGPHPYPTMVREFQSVIGDETKRQILEHEGKLPDYVFACVGGGSNAIGMFSAFIGDEQVKLIGVEPAGKGLDTNCHGATLNKGSAAVLHGMKSLFLQDSNGQIQESYSISAGLDYPGVGPQHAHLQESGRAQYYAVTDDEVLKAFHALSELEGIIPALEPSHAIAQVMKMKFKPDDIIVICLSGRGDKDLTHVACTEGESI